MEQSGPSQNSPVRRNPSGKYVLSSQRKIIINIYKKIIQQTPELKYRDIIKAISKECGIGQLTITKSISEYRKTGHVSSPNKCRKKPTIMEKLSDQAKNSIRKKVHEFWLRREVPNLVKILTAVNADAELSTFSKSSLHRVLKELNFEFTLKHKNSALIERNDIVVWRFNYLTKLAEYRKEGRPIYYLDETWVNAGDCRKKIWVDKSVVSSRDTRERNLSARIPALAGKGKGLIVLHIGSVEGFVPGGLLCFESKTNSEDYHGEINGQTFLRWFKNILPLLKERAVVVMDNAPYHSVKREECPTMSWTKGRIVDWLLSKQQEIPPGAGKAVLMEEVKKIKPKFDKHIIDEYAKQYNKIVLRLPPYHCELNPIILAWTMIKNHVKINNTTYKLADVKKLLLEGIENVTLEAWENFVHHTDKEEAKLAILDNLTDELIDNLLLVNPATTAVTETESDSDSV